MLTRTVAIFSLLSSYTNGVDARLFGRNKKNYPTPKGQATETREVLAVPDDQNDAGKGGKSRKGEKGSSKKHDESSYQPDVTLYTNEIRITVTNVDIGSLSSGETIFFEDSFMSSYEAMKEDILGDEQDGVEARSMIVVNRSHSSVGTNHHDHDRNLAWAPGNYFDINAMFEWSCFLCVDDDDYYYDDDDSAGGVESLFDTPFFFWGYTPSRIGDGSRHLDSDKNLDRRWGDLLCETLRNGPYEMFDTAEDCFVTILG